MSQNEEREKCKARPELTEKRAEVMTKDAIN